MKKEMIYDMMNGLLACDGMVLPGDIWVKDEFLKGSQFNELSERIYDAKIRIGDKLGNEEDEDLEEISDCMEELIRIVAMKMYDYGKEVALKQKSSNEN